MLNEIIRKNKLKVLYIFFGITFFRIIIMVDINIIINFFNKDKQQFIVDTESSKGLWLRSEPKILERTVITKLKNEEEVIFIDKGKFDIYIEKNDLGIPNRIRIGYWVKVKSEERGVGWCFSPYLKEI